MRIRKWSIELTIFASVNYLSSALVKENLSYFSFTLPRKTCQAKTCQGELASVYSPQVFLDKWTCQGKLAGVNEALFTIAAMLVFKLSCKLAVCYAGGKHWKKGKLRKIGSSKY